MVLGKLKEAKGDFIMKTIWKGTISFGLVNIPVHLYSTSSEPFGFRLLHKVCHTPIQYKRWCPNCQIEVAWQDVVKGVAGEDKVYTVVPSETLEELKPEKSDVIEILEFVPEEALAPLYLECHYYVLPAKETDKAFFLFCAALQESDLIAIGRFVLLTNEHICAISPYKKGLLLSTLNYAYEIKEFKKIEELQPPTRITQKELKIAKQLIDQLTHKRFDMSKYKSPFAESLKKHMQELGDKEE